MRYLVTSVLVAISSFHPLVAQSSDFTSRSSPPALTREDLESWLDGFVPPALRKGDIAGLAISVVQGDSVLLTKGYGLADVANRIPMAANTVVRAASISKTFTAMAVMQLVEQGKLDLDRDVNEYLDFTIPMAFGRPITLRHLLTHTAGFEEIAYKRYRPPQTLRDHVLAVPDRIGPPGTVPAYSNYSFALAGHIIARVSGESFTSYIERHVLAPLLMEHSTFHTVLPEVLLPLAAENYSVASVPQPFPPALYVELPPVDAPASGLATTAIDMTRFMLAHLNRGRVGEGQVLRPETLELMHESSFVPASGLQPIALGLFRTDRKGIRVIGHSGDGEGAHAEMKLFPDQAVGIFIVMNSDGVVEGLFPSAFTLRTQLFDTFLDRYFPGPATAPRPALPTAKAHARMVAGEYAWSRQTRGDFQEAIGLIGRFAMGSVIRAAEDGTIETPPSIAFETGGRRQRWREVEPFIWQDVSGDARLIAHVDGGRVRWLWSDQAPSIWVNLPVPFLLSARLNVPLLGCSLLVLLLTTLWWPIGALVRRRRDGGLPPASRFDRLTRIAGLLGTLYLVGWGMVLANDLASKTGVGLWIRLLQLLGLAAAAGAGIAVWNAVLAWREPRPPGGRLVRALVALALLDVVWFSLAFRLLSVDLP